mgnify:FL=1
MRVVMRNIFSLSDIPPREHADRKPGSRKSMSMFWKALVLSVFGGSSILAAETAQAQYVGRISAFVEDARTGTVLAQINPDLQRYPASLTKLMTLYRA